MTLEIFPQALILSAIRDKGLHCQGYPSPRYNGDTVHPVVNIKIGINKVHLIYKIIKNTLRWKCDMRVKSRICLILYICINVKINQRTDSVDSVGLYQHQIRLPYKELLFSSGQQKIQWTQEKTMTKGCISHWWALSLHPGNSVECFFPIHKASISNPSSHRPSTRAAV